MSVPPPSRRASGRTGPRPPAATRRRPADHGLHRPPRHRAVPAGSPSLLVAALAVLLLVSVIAAGLDDSSRDTPAGDPAAGAGPARRHHRAGPGPAAAGCPATRRPGPRSGSAYVEQARVTRQPRLLPEGAGRAGPVARSCARRATPPPLVGLGALANARHDFAAARALRRAGAGAATRPAPRRTACSPTRPPSSATPRPPPPPCSACSTCGPAWPRSPARPTSWSCTAASTRRGRRWSGRSGAATSRDELAFCHYYLGELAWGGGDLEEARAQYERGLAAAPGDPALLHGRAKVLAAARPGRRGDRPRYDRLTAAGAAAAVPARVRRAAGVGRPVARGAGPSTGCSASSSGSTPRRARPTTWPPRCWPPTTATPPRRSGWPRPSGRAGRASSPPTRWPGRCTRRAGTPRRCR